MQAKRELWRRHCEEIEKAPECARLHRILSKDEQGAISSILLENGEHTNIEKGTLEELLRVHFPGSEIILEPSGGWDSLELEFPNWTGSRADWALSRRVNNYEKLKWAVFSFQSYKSPGNGWNYAHHATAGLRTACGKTLDATESQSCTWLYPHELEAYHGGFYT
jgi:hypothetical protein